MVEITFETKEYKWTRTGKCNRCGQCCIDEKCSHFAWIKGVATCLIYDKRDQDCEECNEKFGGIKENRAGGSRNHKVCINFPDHPFLNCLKSGKCGYKFIREVK